MASSTEIQAWVNLAKEGNTRPLERYFKTVYNKLKPILIHKLGSKSLAEEYLALTMAKFWEKFVHENHPLPSVNFDAYFMVIAKNAYIDDSRKKDFKLLDLEGNVKEEEVEYEATSEEHFLEIEYVNTLKEKSMLAAMEELTDICKDIFNIILKVGISKPSEMQSYFNNLDVRQITARKYDCMQQLKRRAAEVFDQLLEKQKK